MQVGLSFGPSRLTFAWTVRTPRLHHAIAIAGLAIGLGAMPALAQDAGDNSSAGSIAPQVATSGKLATHTQIVANDNKSAILTPGSEEALAEAIVLYERIVENGGWPQITGKKLAKGAKGDRVLMLRQRLILENYLPFETLGGANGSFFDAQMLEAVKAFQINHGVAPTGTVGERTIAELNIPAEARLATLQENQARVSTYMQDLGERYILVNIPSAQLETVDGIPWAKQPP